MNSTSRPWTSPAYTLWIEGVRALQRTIIGRYAGCGQAQALNAARAQALRHIREARARMSLAEATDIWSATGHCNQCKRPIVPGDPYVVWHVAPRGVPAEVLVCHECEFHPGILWVLDGPVLSERPTMTLAQARALAASTIEKRRRERWARQDGLKHRGAWWRLRRWLNWWWHPLPALLLLPPLHTAGTARRIVTGWTLHRRLRSSMRPPRDRSFGGQRLIGQYTQGKRRFVKAELARAQLQGASLERANLSLSDMHHAYLSRANLTSALVERADLEEANLWKANLTGASLEGANLHWAFLVGANLEQADLSGADLFGANLYEARVTETQLARAARLEGALMPDGTVHE